MLVYVCVILALLGAIQKLKIFDIPTTLHCLFNSVTNNADWKKHLRKGGPCINKRFNYDFQRSLELEPEP